MFRLTQIEAVDYD